MTEHEYYLLRVKIVTAKHNSEALHASAQSETPTAKAMLTQSLIFNSYLFARSYSTITVTTTCFCGLSDGDLHGYVGRSLMLYC